MIAFALNQVTVSNAPFGAFLDLAARLGCVGIEARNDLGRPLFDGLDAARAADQIRDRGLRLLGLSQVYPFNTWLTEIANETRALIDDAAASGAETISLIPLNDGTETAPETRRENLRRAMENILPLLENTDLLALIEPLGFQRSSLRYKSELVAEIDALDAADHVKLVHDTFHHALADETDFFPASTGMVHISGVANPNPTFDQMEDDDRVLVGRDDRLGNIDQLARLQRGGYAGPVSMECFAPEIHGLEDPESAIKRSFDFISSRLEALAA